LPSGNVVRASGGTPTFDERFAITDTQSNA
jgi:hypothetical protein